MNEGEKLRNKNIVLDKLKDIHERERKRERELIAPNTQSNNSKIPG